MNDFKLKKSSNMLANQFLTGFTANSSNGNDAKSLPINLSELTKNTQQAFKNSGQCSFVDIGKVLLQASKDGDTTKVHECMKNGAPFTTDWLGTSPLHFAAKYNHVETCATLLRAGISKDAKTKVDRTPLHFAVYEGHYEVVKLLLSANCDIEQIDMLKMTPLHWAVEKCHYGIVELLLERGANRNTVSKFGKTPYSMARQKGDVQLMRLFDMYGQSSKKDTRDATDSVMMEIEQQKKKDENDLNQFKHHENSARKETISSKRQKLGSTSSIDSIDEASNIAFKLLKDHGIQMLQNDDELDSSALIQNALQGGRKIVLSEAGKLIMNDTKLNRFLKVPFNTTITTSNVPPLSPTFGNPPLSPLLGRNPPPSPLLLHPSRIPPPHSPLSRSAPPSSPLSRNPPPSPLARNTPEPLHISKNIPNRNPTPTRKSDTPDTPTFQVSLSDDEINGAANLKQNDKNAMKLNSFFKPYSLSDQVQDLTSSNRCSMMSAVQHLQLPIKPSVSKNDIHKKLYVPKNKMNLFENNLKLKNSVVGNSHARRHHSTSSLSPTSEDSLISTEFVEPTTPRTPQHLNSSDLEMLIDKKFKELQHGYTELKQNFEREQQKSEGYRSQLVQLQKDFEMYKIQQQDKFDSLLKLLASRSSGGTDDDYNNYSNMIEENNGMDLTS